MDNLEPEVIDKDAPPVDESKDTSAPKPEDTAKVEAEPKAEDAPKVEGEPDDDGKKDDEPKSAWGDDWRDQMAGGDEDIAAIIKRYGSPKAIAKALKDAKDTIRSGKLKRDMPDPKDEKAFAEWRKEQGIPDDPSGYKLPETVQKRLTDDDKPVLANFTEFAHKKNAPPEFVNMATEWYIESLEQMEAQRLEQDQQFSEATEDTLRKDWSHGEYKANLTLGHRYIESIPGVGKAFTEFRGPDGRRLGDIPEFVMWASDMGRDKFGDVAFANSDSERKHTARREEIEKIRDTDFDRYESEGLDKELRSLIDKDLARGKR